MNEFRYLRISLSKNSQVRNLKGRILHIRKSRRGQQKAAKKKSTLKSVASRKYLSALVAEGISPGEVQHRIKKKIILLKFPEILSVRDHINEIAAFFVELNYAFFVTRANNVIIDHSALREASPDGVLVLIAELQRLTKYSPKTSLKADFSGTCGQVMAVFELVGYLKNFGIQWTACEEEKRLFLKYERGVGAIASKSGQIVKEFTSNGYLTQSEGLWLGKGLVECMDNTCDHAYRINFLERSQLNRRLRKNWWLLAYTDPENSEISFSFYDQGAGLSNTLRFKKRDTLATPIVRELISRSDEELILEAFMRPFSRTKQENRGVGLPKLRTMVQNSSSGELFVQSRHSRVFLRPKAEIATFRSKIPLDGTLLVWKIRRDGIQTN